MNVDEAAAQRPVAFLEPQAADHTRQAVVVDARLASRAVSLVCVHKNLPDRSFAILAASNLLRTLDVQLALGKWRFFERPENLNWCGINNLDRRSDPGILERRGV